MASRIEDYAMIGDGRTVALVSREGSIDWLCLPRFDSDACCAALLGTEQHGAWRIAPRGPARTQRRYQGDTLVLQTDFTTDTGAVRLTDCLVMGTDHPVILRRLAGLAGRVTLGCDIAFRFDYGLLAPRLRQRDDALVAIAGPHKLVLRTSVPLQRQDDGSTTAVIQIGEGQSVDFSLAYAPSHAPEPKPIDPDQALRDTLGHWQAWAGQFQRETPWREPVMRSLLTLKGLIHHDTGAMVAAPTTSLPEMPGGGLNWDYRYCWLRDASFTLSALLNAGYHAEAAAWHDWMLRAIAADPAEMRIMYRVDGDRRIYEQSIPWLPGHGGAQPVRVGNDAAAQRQIDVVGELLDALNLMQRAGIDGDTETHAAETELVRHLQRTWHDKGHGLWESRGRPQRFTYSVAMAWVGVDRYLDSCERRGEGQGVLQDEMRALRQRIHDDIMDNCWHRARGHFVDRFGGERVDASLLLLPLVNFLPADDPRMAATIDAVERELCQDGLVWRTPHGGDTEQGAFIACTCWLADCRALQGRRDEAVALLEKVLSLRNDVGLLAEEYHPGLQRLMGNFPQALSHLAVINTALGLSGPVLQRGGG